MQLGILHCSLYWFLGGLPKVCFSFKVADFFAFTLVLLTFHRLYFSTDTIYISFSIDKILNWGLWQHNKKYMESLKLEYVALRVIFGSESNSFNHFVSIFWGYNETFDSTLLYDKKDRVWFKIKYYWFMYEV